MLQNFPHQYSDINTIIDILGIIYYNMIPYNKDFYDDFIFGKELYDCGIYRFRETFGLNPNERFLVECQKPNQNQGFRTAAREMRRFFNLLGFISENKITNLGFYFLSCGKLLSDLSVCNMWNNTLLNIQLINNLSGDSFHPYYIMLKLYSYLKNIQDPRLSLAFEAENDSDIEFDRLLNILHQNNWKELIGANDTQISNSIKILPSMIRQLEANPYFFATNVLIQNICPLSLRKTTPATIARFTINNKDDVTVTKNYPLDSIKLREQRTEQHQNIVREIASILYENNYSIYENPVDCMAIKHNYPTLLIEVKTLSEDYSDQQLQVRLALSQLLYYDFFYLKRNLNIFNIAKIAFFDKDIDTQYIDFLSFNNCMFFSTQGNTYYSFKRFIENQKQIPPII